MTKEGDNHTIQPLPEPLVSIQEFIGITAHVKCWMCEMITEPSKICTLCEGHGSTPPDMHVVRERVRAMIQKIEADRSKTAARLKAQELVIEKAKEALDPFAHPELQHFSPSQMHEGDNSPMYGRGKATLRLGNFKKADAALALINSLNK